MCLSVPMNILARFQSSHVVLFSLFRYNTTIQSPNPPLRGVGGDSEVKLTTVIETLTSTAFLELNIDDRILKELWLSPISSLDWHFNSPQFIWRYLQREMTIDVNLSHLRVRNGPRLTNNKI